MLGGFRRPVGGVVAHIGEGVGAALCADASLAWIRARRTRSVATAEELERGPHLEQAAVTPRAGPPTLRA